MFRFAIISAFVTLTISQEYRHNQQPVAIISEQRYLSGDGKFGAAYSQEDGINFKEETDSDGTRHGSYSYVDPTGQRRTISYTAGKNGFQPTGDHLPVPPPALPQPAPTPSYQPQPQYQPPTNIHQESKGNNYYDDGSYDTRYNNPSYGQQPTYSAPQQPSNYQNYQQPPEQYRPHQYQPTTPNPQRFKPPGKLSLNRTPDGFSFSFNKV